MTIKDVGTAAILKEVGLLTYSRAQEAESDDYSVRYLSSSNYACDGTAGFFQKLLDEGDGARIPEFLSSHPDPAARVGAIRKAAAEAGCSTKLGDPSTWKAFQTSLPTPEKSEKPREKGETE
jgi:predicted Zn-dependent protease